MPFLPILLAFFIAIASVNAKEVQPSPADVARHQAELALAAGRTAEARYWYQEAIGHDGESASIGGDPALVYNLAVLNYGDGVTRNLYELLDYAAASGISAADVLLGDLYESGRSGFPHGPSRAREHWQRAAAVGDNRVRLRLAVDDPAMLNAAAAAGDPTALWLLAAQEEQTGDAARALADYRQAAANGSTAAMTRLGLHYLSLSPPHTFAARHWLEKAAARGDSVAENYLRYLYLQQSSDTAPPHAPPPAGSPASPLHKRSYTTIPTRPRPAPCNIASVMVMVGNAPISVAGTTGTGNMTSRAITGNRPSISTTTMHRCRSAAWTTPPATTPPPISAGTAPSATGWQMHTLTAPTYTRVANPIFLMSRNKSGSIGAPLPSQYWMTMVAAVTGLFASLRYT